MIAVFQRCLTLSIYINAIYTFMNDHIDLDACERQNIVYICGVIPFTRREAHASPSRRASHRALSELNSCRIPEMSSMCTTERPADCSLNMSGAFLSVHDSGTMRTEPASSR